MKEETQAGSTVATAIKEEMERGEKGRKDVQFWQHKHHISTPGKNISKVSLFADKLLLKSLEAENETPVTLFFNV